MIVTAKVQITLEVILSQPWDEKCPASQVAKQAKSSAEMTVNQLISKSHPGIRMIGKPRVQMVVTELEDIDEN